jgi:hypothetical protein
MITRGLQAINGSGAHFLGALTLRCAPGEDWGGRRDSNPQQQAPQAWTLPLSYDHQPDRQARSIRRVRQVCCHVVRACPESVTERVPPGGINPQ